MFESGHRKPRNKLAVEIELDGQPSQTLFSFVAPGTRLVDMLNDDRAFLPFETADGSIVIIKKSSIRRVTPLESGVRRASRDPYELLGITPMATDDQLHEAYRKSIASVHPDHIQSLGLPSEFLELATVRAALINESYAKIKRERARSK